MPILRTRSYAQELSDITIAWDEGATRPRWRAHHHAEVDANWQLGNEAWAATGYRLMPATEDGNKSLGVVDSGTQGAPYALSGRRITTNNVNVNNAVSSLLKGTDNMATRMWWDCNPAIK